MIGDDDQPGGEASGREIAVVGMAGRFPGARDLRQLWQNLRLGVEAVTFFSDEELLAAGVAGDQLRDPRYVKAGSLLAGVEDFDAGFFGYNAREAEVMDPQQRLFLEHAWEALEDAGYAPDACPGVVGIYAGVAWNTYLLSNLTTHPELFDGGGAFQVFIANDKDFMPSKVSYKLNLKGPSVVVQTSCSTSLVAIHLACLSLLSYECDTALAGGVTIKVPQVAGYHALDGGLASPDGHCRAFDARAAGTLFGSGAGVVVLKRLADALADGDAIRAVIKGSAINNDGSLKVSYTAPSVEGQAEVIAAAQAVAGVDPSTVTYVEAHGTGTALGDPIEVAALTKVFREATDRTGFCALGSIKTNLGHLDAAAGVAGFLKTVLSLEHRELPPSLHFEVANPAIDFAASPFFVNREARPWQTDDGQIRRAGVSSFGVGGTNAHVILEEAPPPAPAAASRPWQLLTLSARSAAALEQATDNLLAWLRTGNAGGGGEAGAAGAGAGGDDPDLADAAWTLRVGRSVFRHRRTVVCRDRAGAIAALAARDDAAAAGRLATAADAGDPRERPVVFLLPGLAAPPSRLAVELGREPVFAAAVARAGELLAGRAGRDGEAVSLFVFEHALAQLWISWGIAPEALLGHGIGEWVAACLAGVIALPDALALLALRDGANGADDADSAGFAAAVAKVPLRAPQIPFVSSVTGTWITPAQAMAPAYWAQLPWRPAAETALGAGSGDGIAPAAGTSPAPATATAGGIAAGLAELLGDPRRILLEVGAGAGLCALAEALPRPAELAIVPSLPAAIALAAGGDAQGAVLAALGRLWLAGRRIDWSGFHDGESRRRLALPTYPFERQRYWIEPRPRAGGRELVDEIAGSLQRRPDVADWFWLPAWRPALPARAALSPALPPDGQVPASPAAPAVVPSTTDRWLILAPASGPGAALARHLAQSCGAGATAGGAELGGAAAAEAGSGAAPSPRDRRVVIVEPLAAGGGLQRREAGSFAIDPLDAKAWEALAAALAAEDALADVVLHLWGLDSATPQAGTAAAFEAAQGPGLYALIELVRALDRRGCTPRELTVAASGLLGLHAGEAVRPELAPLLGLLRVLPQEVAGLACRALDVDLGAPRDPAALARLEDDLAAEIAAGPGAGDRVAWRAGQRWLPAPAAVRLEDPGADAAGVPRPLRRGGAYLLTGGLSGDGFGLARWLAQAAGARLALLEDPRAAAWDAARVRQLEELGAQVSVLPVVPGDEAATRAAIALAEERFGPLHGVIHAAGAQAQNAFRLVRELDREACGWHLQPKAHAAYALDRALAGRDLDFCILLSSLAADLGGVANAAYAAANAFLDAFAQDRARGGGLPWRSLGWDLWALAGEGEPGGVTAMRSDLADLAMSAGEGAEAFRRAAAAPNADRLLVSTADLAARLAQAGGRRGAHAPRQVDAAERHPRPPLAVPFAPPEGDLERRIAEVWQAALGFAEVGVDDNFFELGGDSLVAVQVASRLQDVLGIQLQVATLYQGLTIRALAGLLGRDGDGAAAELAAHLAERRQSMDRRREMLQRRRARSEALQD